MTEQVIIAKFYVSGGLVETYRCLTVPPCQADEDRMAEIKQNLVRNFGYAPIVVWEHDYGCEKVK